jgi:hypothetical protein
MADLDTVIDKSSAWPCFTPGMHWALSDKIYDIGRMSKIDLNNDCIEYDVDLDDLPLGDKALHKFNAIHNFVVYANELPKVLAVKAAAATMCIGEKAVEQVAIGPTGKAVFSLFSGQSILPLFVLENQKLTIRLHFKDLTHAEAAMAPREAVDAVGLLVNIKDQSSAFFVAACETAVITYDGFKACVIQKASEDSENPDVRVKKLSRRKELFGALYDPSDYDLDIDEAPREDTRVFPNVSDDNSNFMDMLTALNEN